MVRPVLVRPLAPEDLEAWSGLWDGYNAFYGRAGPTALDDEITRATWTRLFDEREPMFGLIGECEGQVVGLAHCIFHRSTTSLGLSCYLQDLYTTEAARGRGVGRALIEAVYHQASIQGSPRVYWQTHETNATARRLYDAVAERSGFLVYRKLL